MICVKECWTLCNFWKKLGTNGNNGSGTASLHPPRGQRDSLPDQYLAGVPFPRRPAAARQCAAHARERPAFEQDNAGFLESPWKPLTSSVPLANDSLIASRVVVQKLITSTNEIFGLQTWEQKRTVFRRWWACWIPRLGAIVIAKNSFLGEFNATNREQQPNSQLETHLY